MPELGEHVYYVQQYSDGDPSKIYRQRLYSFSANPEEDAIELVIYAPPDTAAVVDAHLDWRPIEIHDQGGHYDFVPPGAEEGAYAMELFQAVYTGEKSVPVLKLAIREKGKEKSIAYAWADPSSERIGINLRTVQTGCKLKDN